MTSDNSSLKSSEEKTFKFIRQWITQAGHWSKPIDTLAKYIGISESTTQRHLKKLVSLGLLFCVRITGHPSLYLEKELDTVDALKLCFYLNPVKGGYRGHEISLYGGEKRHYDRISVLRMANSSNKEFTIDEKLLPY